MAISRDARKILDTMREQGGVNTLPFDVLEAEKLALKYYSKTVCAIIKQYYPKAKSDPNRVSYYTPILKSYKKGIRNKEDLWEITEQEIENYWLISSFLIVDYSYEDLKLLKELCKYNTVDIKEGIRSAEKENTHSIHYLHRIIESIVASRTKREEQRQKLKELHSYQCNDDTINRSMIELASLKHSWKNSLENKELEKKSQKVWEDMLNEK